MSNPIVAITAGVYYLNKTQWCVKHLKIGHRLNGKPFWVVSGMVSRYKTESEAVELAREITEQWKIPYFYGVRHGEAIRYHQKRALEHYGITVK